MKGRVVFWYRMRRQGEQIVAETQFKLYGQQCHRCDNYTKVIKYHFSFFEMECNIFCKFFLVFDATLVSRGNRERHAPPLYRSG